jgi:hypothetical protein
VGNGKQGALLQNKDIVTLVCNTFINKKTWLENSRKSEEEMNKVIRGPTEPPSKIKRPNGASDHLMAWAC